MNRKSELPPLSPAQLEIMHYVWDQRDVTVGQIWKELASRRKVARNTVQTLVVRLRDKGWLLERVVDGIYLYRATRQREGTLRQIVSRVVDSAFAGSAEGMVMALLDSRQLSSDEADRIRKLIDAAEASGGRNTKPKQRNQKMRMPLVVVLTLVGSCWAEERPKRHNELRAAKAIEVAGKPLDIEREGHAAPYFADLDNDGRKDLLVGQFSEGKLRIYRNIGTAQQPKFEGYRFLRAGGKDASVPAD